MIIDNLFTRFRAWRERQRKLKELTRDIFALESMRDDLISENANLKSAQANISKKLKLNKVQLSDIIKEVKSIESKFEHLNQKVERTETKLKDLDTEVHTKRVALDELNKKFDGLQIKLNHLEKKIEKRKARLNDLDVQFESKKIELAAINNLNTEITLSNANLGQLTEEFVKRFSEWFNNLFK